MKIQQMAFMLVAVTIFFVLIGLVVLGIHLSGLEERATELSRKNARLLVSNLADSPEFSCGEALGSSRSDCIDMDKVMALSSKAETYEGLWGVSKIEVKRVYPERGSGGCNQGNYPNCNSIEVIDRLEGQNANFTSAQNFVSLCRKTSDGSQAINKCSMGKLLVSYENVA